MALVAWVGAQALWLQQGFELEFKGRSTFVPGLWVSGVGFFVVNCWILGVVVGDIGRMGRKKEERLEKSVLNGGSLMEGENVRSSQRVEQVKIGKRKS